MFDVENVGYLAQKNNAKTVDMHEYNEKVRDLCKMTIDRYKSKCYYLTNKWQRMLTMELTLS